MRHDQGKSRRKLRGFLTETGRNRLLFLLWCLALIILFFYKGQAAVTVLLIFTAAYAAAAWLLTRFSGRMLQAGFTGGDMVEKGGTMTMTIELKNRGKLPVFCCTCEAEALNRLTGEVKKQPVTMSLPPGGSQNHRFDLTDQYCGRVELSLQNVQVSDPLRIFRGRRQTDLLQIGSGQAAIGYFAPQMHPADIPAEFLDSYNMESYQYSQYEKGSDPGEVFGVREYQEGDSLKQIHWKLTAKLGEVTVKIPSFPIENNILMILDNLLDPQAEITPAKKSALVEMFYSLSAALLEKAIPHSIGWYDSKEGIFLQRQIRSDEDLWASVPEVLGCGFERSEVSTVYRYLESREGAGFTNHFLVSAVDGRDRERLESYGAVNVFQTTE